MKVRGRIVLILGALILYTGCKKETAELPDPNCYNFELKLISLSNSNPIDSLRIQIRRVGENENFVNLPLVNPANGFEFGSNFCGDFVYKIDFYHTKSVEGWNAKLTINGDSIETNFKVNGFSILEGKYPF